MLRKLSAIIFALTICVAISAATQQRQESTANQPQMKPREIPPEISRRVQTLQSKLQPSASAWVEQQAKLESQKPALDAASIEAAARNRFPALNTRANSANADDINALVAIVMMQAANDSEKDLQNMMAQMLTINSAKQQLRDLLSQVQLEIKANPTPVGTTRCQTALCKSLADTINHISDATVKLPKPVRIAIPAKLTYSDLKDLSGQIKSNLDNMNEMSEMTSLRLQMLMDRRSKFIETLSNIMKKIDDTNSGTLQNIK